MSERIKQGSLSMSLTPEGVKVFLPKYEVSFKQDNHTTIHCWGWVPYATEPDRDGIVQAGFSYLELAGSWLPRATELQS